MEPLGNVILQARNQAFHFEEGDPRPKLKACFAHLHADFGIPDDLTQNLARFVVIDVLGWDSYEAYHMDLLSNF
jgi:hypothetical protein